MAILKLKQQGLTITELLVVVAVIAILAAVAIWYARGQIFKGSDAKKKGDLETLRVALEEYEKDYDCYPITLPACKPGDGLKPYLNKIPCDPDTDAGYLYEPDPSLTCPRWYRMYASLKYTSDLSIAKLGCTYGCGPNLAFNYYVSSSNAPSPSQGSGESAPPPPVSGFFGCFSGACSPINWDPDRPGPECDPNYQDANCFAQCGQPMTECTPWDRK